VNTVSRLGIWRSAGDEAELVVEGNVVFRLPLNKAQTLAEAETDADVRRIWGSAGGM
jgi:hypothetical protein